MEKQIAIKIENVKKRYKLGQIGGGTLKADLESWWARKLGKEDPNLKIGVDQRLFGQTFMALNGVDLDIYKGEAVGIIGSNGAGKSTLLKLLSQVTAPTDGDIDIYGRVASMLEVGTGFNGEMTGRENIYLNGAILGMTKAEIDAKMEDIIEFSEVRDFIDTPVKRYSSGMFVKLAFSVAAHLDAEIMIMDEVLAVGDMAFQTKCLDKMREVANKEGRTVLYVSHNMNTIRKLCDRCIVLDRGKVVFEGDVEEAIQIYLGVEEELTNSYVYSDKNHSDERTTGEFMIESLNTTNSDNMIFGYGGIIEFEMAFSTKRMYKNVGMRFEIKTKNGVSVGTMLTRSTIDFEANDSKIVKIKMDLDHLVNGVYIADIVAYNFDEFGNEQFLDGVYPGMFFEINDKINEKQPLRWLHQYWGHVHLQDITIVD